MNSRKRMSRILKRQPVDWVGLFEVFWRETAVKWAVEAHFGKPDDTSDCFGLNVRRPDGVDWDGIQYQHPATGRGALVVFKPAARADTRRVILRGLDRTKTYALTFQDRPEQNARKAGAELMDDGFDLTMAGQFVSEIVWIVAAEGGSAKEREP